MYQTEPTPTRPSPSSPTHAAPPSMARVPSDRILGKVNCQAGGLACVFFWVRVLSHLGKLDDSAAASLVTPPASWKLREDSRSSWEGSRVS